MFPISGTALFRFIWPPLASLLTNVSVPVRSLGGGFAALNVTWMLALAPTAMVNEVGCAGRLKSTSLVEARAICETSQVWVPVLVSVTESVALVFRERLPKSRGFGAIWSWQPTSMVAVRRTLPFGVAGSPVCIVSVPVFLWGGPPSVAVKVT